jgi:hypothetical protein
MTEITLICEACRRPMTDAEPGALSVPFAAIRASRREEREPRLDAAVDLAEFIALPDGPRWTARHYACQPADAPDCYGISHDELRAWADVARWTAHLLAKNWLPASDWDEVLREAAGISPSKRIRASERQAA